MWEKEINWFLDDSELICISIGIVIIRYEMHSPAYLFEQ